MVKPPSVCALPRRDGLIIADGTEFVPAYVGSQCGFHHPGQIFLNEHLYPDLRRIGVFPLCPFAACEEYLGQPPSPKQPLEVHSAYWHRFNQTVPEINIQHLMPLARFMIAIAEGPSLDDGMTSEIVEFAKSGRPVVGIRSDFRLAENLAAPINPQVRYYFDTGPYKNPFFVGGAEAYKDAFDHIEGLVARLR